MADAYQSTKIEIDGDNVDKVNPTRGATNANPENGQVRVQPPRSHLPDEDERAQELPTWPLHLTALKNSVDTPMILMVPTALSQSSRGGLTIAQQYCHPRWFCQYLNCANPRHEFTAQQYKEIWKHAIEKEKWELDLSFMKKGGVLNGKTLRALESQIKDVINSFTPEEASIQASTLGRSGGLLGKSEIKGRSKKKGTKHDKPFETAFYGPTPEQANKDLPELASGTFPANEIASKRAHSVDIEDKNNVKRPRFARSNNVEAVEEPQIQQVENDEDDTTPQAENATSDNGTPNLGSGIGKPAPEIEGAAKPKRKAPSFAYKTNPAIAKTNVPWPVADLSKYRGKTWQEALEDKYTEMKAQGLPVPSMRYGFSFPMPDEKELIPDFPFPPRWYESVLPDFNGNRRKEKSKRGG